MGQIQIFDKMRKLAVHSDSLDFRDKIYVPSLKEVPPKISISKYKELQIPILDQGLDGACTGYALATVAHFLLKNWNLNAELIQVSPKMYYEMAKRYDEWAGNNYNGSSARGAIKGWHKHGVCSLQKWPSDSSNQDQRLTRTRMDDAMNYPLGAYFRVDHRDLVAMHCALSEVGILFATAQIHIGWQSATTDGIIQFDPNKPVLGGHAFAIVAYDQEGFWIQNSWGKQWGDQGLGKIAYDDWLIHGTDVWVARLGVPIKRFKNTNFVQNYSMKSTESESFMNTMIQPHVISLGNDGLLRSQGSLGTDSEMVKEIFLQASKVMQQWEKPRLLIFAHGGLTDESSAKQRVIDYLPALMQAQIYPVSLIWKTDFWSTLSNMIQDAFNQKCGEGHIQGIFDSMLDRLDDTLEPLARILGGKALWDEMKENALLATLHEEGGLRYVAQEIKNLKELYQDNFEIHFVNHSAGSILQAPLATLLATSGKIQEWMSIKGHSLNGINGFGIPIESVTFWAPACTTELFKLAYLPIFKSGNLKKLNIFTLTDLVEQEDHCADIYHKSLLYLVSNAFEKDLRKPGQNGQPILGMEKFIHTDSNISSLFDGLNNESNQNNWTRVSDMYAKGKACLRGSHGGFDDDLNTVQQTFKLILGSQLGPLHFHRSSNSKKTRRKSLEFAMSNTRG
jgi:hypothetical protein